MSATLVNVLAVVAPVIYLVRLLPQPVRLWRTGVAAGVSPLAAMNGVIGDLAWVVYGISAGLPAVWVVCAFALIPAIWTFALLRPEVRRSNLIVAAVWALALVVSAMFGAIGITLGLGVLVIQGPQVWTALRDDDLRGIAPGAWWISVLDATAWGLYGVGIDDGALMGYGVVLNVAAAIVLGRIWWTDRRRDQRCGSGESQAAAQSM